MCSMFFLKYIVIFSLFLSQTAFAAGTDDSSDTSSYDGNYKLGLELVKKKNINLQ